MSFPWFFHFSRLSRLSFSIHIENKQHTAEACNTQLISELQLHFRTIWSSSATYQWQDSIPRDSGSVALGWGSGSDSFPSSPKWLIKCSGLRIIEPGIRWHEWWSILFPRSEVAENPGDCRELSPGGYQLPMTTCWCHLFLPFPHHDILRVWGRRVSGVPGAQHSAQAVKVTVIEKMPSF